MTTVALITGANKGIGYETARLLGERGMTVLLGARDRTLGAEAERGFAKPASRHGTFRSMSSTKPRYGRRLTRSRRSSAGWTS